MPSQRQVASTLRVDWRILAALAAGIAAGLALFGRPAAQPSRTDTPVVATVAPPSRAGIRFTDVTTASGIRFTHENGRTGRYRYPEILGAGVALFDYDNDDDLDVYLVNGNRLDQPPDPSIRSALYRNEGNGTFTDVSIQAGVAAVGYGQGACVGDVDGDGHRDLYVTFFGSSQFFRNRGNGTFASMTREAGLENAGWGQSCAFLDYDGDGHLDLYVLNYLTYSLDMPQERTIVLEGQRLPDYLGPQPFAGAPSRLFRNRGDGTFVDVTRPAGVYRPGGKGMGVACVDFDGDGRTDIFQANDGIEDYLFHNLGRGRFEEVGLTAGVAVSDDGQPKASMGVDVGDIDNDGDLDLAIPVVRQEVFSLFRNERMFFEDVSWASGLAEATGRLTGFSAHFADFDNDGDLDLFFTNGEVQSHERVAANADDPTRYGTPAVVLANEAGHFLDVSRSAGSHFQRPLIGRGAAAGDLDNDGDVDLVISVAAGPVVVLRNDSPSEHWLRLVLRDTGSNWEAIGAKVWVESGGRTQYREVHGAGGYLSANDRRLHFGLGAATAADRIRIRWSDGATEVMSAIPANRPLRIDRKVAE